MKKIEQYYVHVFSYKNAILGLTADNLVYNVNSGELFVDSYITDVVNFANSHAQYKMFFSIFGENEYYWSYGLENFYRRGPGKIFAFPCYEGEPDYICEYHNRLYFAYGSEELIYSYEISGNNLIIDSRINISYPESLFVYDDKLYIAEMGKNRVVSMDANYNIENYHNLDFPVFGYYRDDKFEYFIDSDRYVRIKQFENGKNTYK